MTEKELSGLREEIRCLNIETKLLQEELNELEYSIGVKSVVLSHSPKVKNRRQIGIGVADLAAEIADKKALIQLNLQKIQIKRTRLERYIENINDPDTRFIFRLKYINGLTWREIGAELFMSYTSAFNKHKDYLNK